ncbi:glycosyltransferase family 4 protein [Solimicrobium silvestre]|uniref:Glycosyl transferases group 1 n=1 Tax=Solimicrobium silvestre TaxID=2099400 RepID=A0A2S9GT06_9BURK|nr:glycosyltransferase family 4 protein [Solimicrobium silvestre]PRC90843.1 Glycosyl transferases group 1 [Solimicrobium silvestre]
MSQPNATLLYQAEGYTTNGDKLMGRQAAGEGLLRAAAQSGAVQLSCHTDNPASARHFVEQLAQHGYSGKTNWVPTEHPAGLADSGCLYLPGPNLMDFAWRRAPLGDRTYSLCGITHTTASHIAMTAITDLLIAPVRSWDALICTSTAVRDTVRVLLENQAAYLCERLGANRFELPQLPVIPLGVHTADYVFTENERAAARADLGIGQDDIVMLFVGRLSFHAKAHPQQMFTALERAAKGRRVHLIQCGWFPNAPIEAAFNDAAQVLCPSIFLHYIDGRQAAGRRQAWAAAHIFISLSDNIQETFGLTPIEAMASGIPVIVSDWDGYKDTVRDQIDGFRIPTLTPPVPLGADLAQRYENGTDTYDVYCGLASQLTALDPVALEMACSKLIVDAELRQQMGAAGSARAREVYEWKIIYQRYQTLWAELAEQRRADPNLHGPLKAFHRPDRLDPFAAFASYPTSQLSGKHVVSLRDEAAQLSSRRHMAMNSFAQRVQLSAEECEMIFTRLKQHGTQTVSEVIACFKIERRPYIVRGLVWLAKMEAVHIFVSSNS